MGSPDKTQVGERIFWVIAAVVALIFVVYFIDMYRFSAPQRRGSIQAREQNFGRGISGT